MSLRLTVQFHRETDGRWIADIPEIPGVTAYDATRSKAFAAVRKLALEVIADRLDHGEDIRTGRPVRSGRAAAPAPFRLERNRPSRAKCPFDGPASARGRDLFEGILDSLSAPVAVDMWLGLTAGDPTRARRARARNPFNR